MVKKTSHVPFYFVLYLIAIVTVFAITGERDNLLSQRENNLARLVSLYLKPLHLSPYVDTTKSFIPANASVFRDSVQLRTKVDGPVEKNDVQFSLVRAVRLMPDGEQQVMSNGLRVSNREGDGVLSASSLSEGLYAFTVAGYKPRLRVDGNLVKVTVMDSTYEIAYSKSLESVDRDTTILLLKVERNGAIPNQFTLNVQEGQEKWVLGTPYRKKIFIGGVTDPARVNFSSGEGQIERSAHDQQYVTFVWATPTVGKKSFAISADANRGFGTIDHTSASFSVEVVPPSFVVQPSSKGFWGIPYEFDGQISGLNPLDLSIETLHDGQTLGTKPAVPKQVIVPEKNWRSMTFKIFYNGSVVKEHDVTLRNPPPPQIRWVQERLDKSSNVFVVSAVSSDPTGGPVTISLQTQPSGIARVDKIKGTEFTITIDLGSKPSGVFLKLVAIDKYGSQSVSTKQFNIPL